MSIGSFFTFWPLNSIGIGYKRFCLLSGNGLGLINFDVVRSELFERYKSKFSRYKPFSGFFYFSKFFLKVQVKNQLVQVISASSKKYYR